MARSGKITYKQAARFLLDIECGRMTSAKAAHLNGVTEAAISLWRPYIGLSEKWLTRVKQLERQITVLTRRAKLSERMVDGLHAGRAAKRTPLLRPPALHVKPPRYRIRRSGVRRQLG